MTARTLLSSLAAAALLLCAAASAQAAVVLGLGTDVPARGSVLPVTPPVLGQPGQDESDLGEVTRQTYLAALRWRAAANVVLAREAAAPGSPQLRNSGGEAESWACALDGGAWEDCGAAQRRKLPYGSSHRLTFRACNAAGCDVHTEVFRVAAYRCRPAAEVKAEYARPDAWMQQFDQLPALPKGFDGYDNELVPCRLSPPRVAIAKKAPRLSGGKLRFRLSCPRQQASCRGRIELRTIGKVRVGRKRQVVKLGAASFRLKPGQARTVSVKLSRKARSVVGKRARLKVRATAITRSHRTKRVGKTSYAFVLRSRGGAAR